jgi:hypothetical protein
LTYMPPGITSLNRLIGVIEFARHAVFLRFLTGGSAGWDMYIS